MVRNFPEKEKDRKLEVMPDLIDPGCRAYFLRMILIFLDLYFSLV